MVNCVLLVCFTRKNRPLARSLYDFMRRAEEHLITGQITPGIIRPNIWACNQPAIPRTPLQGVRRHILPLAVMEVLQGAKEVGTPIGIHTFSVEHCNMRIEQGFQLCAMASEAQMMRQAAVAALKQLRRE